MVQVKLVIDSRETALHNAICATDVVNIENVAIYKEQLELADIHIIIHKNDEIIRTLVFERKTLSDLISSIHDGRMREQKLRLLSNLKAENITYIIEGDTMINSMQRTADTKVSSSYTNMMYRDNIKVVFVDNIQENAVFLTSLCKKIILNHTPYTQVVESKQYVDFVKIKSRKISNITPDVCFLMQLGQIPNVSTNIAKKISNVYPNFISLFRAVDSCGNYKQKIQLLSNIDKIGEKKAKLILEYMHL